MLLKNFIADEIGGLFFVALMALILLHDLITGEVTGKFGGWVTRRETQPETYRHSIQLQTGLIILVLGALVYSYWRGK